MFDEVVVAAAAKKKTRREARSKAADGEIPQWVTLSLPAINSDTGTNVDAININVKSPIDVRDAIHVELEPHALHYIRVAMMQSHTDDRPLVERRNDGVRWRNDRKCWLAQRTDGGKLVTQPFRPDGNDDLSIHDAADKAKAWADGIDVHGCDSPVSAEAEAQSSDTMECEASPSDGAVALPGEHTESSTPDAADVDDI